MAEERRINLDRALPIHCSRASEVPTVEHWAILQSHSCSYDGGHGYGQMSVDYMSYVAYLDRSAWEEAVKQARMDSYKQFKAIYVKPAQIVVEVKVS